MGKYKNPVIICSCMLLERNVNSFVLLRAFTVNSMTLGVLQTLRDDEPNTSLSEWPVPSNRAYNATLLSCNDKKLDLISFVEWC